MSDNPFLPPSAPAAEEAPQGGVSSATLEALRGTRPWVMLLGIVGLIGSGLLLVFTLFVAIAGSAGGLGKPELLAAAVVYLLMSLLYVYPSIQLIRFGQAIGRLTAGGAIADLEAALGLQRSFWRYVGVMALVVIALYVVIIVVAIGFGLQSALT